MELYCDDEGRCIRESAAREATARLQQAGTALVMDVTTRREKTPPPLAFTSAPCSRSAQNSGAWARRRYWISPSACMRAIRQPPIRAPTADICRSRCTLKRHRCWPRWLPATPHPALATQLNLQQRSRLWDDSKITAHHGIIPTRKTVDLTQMNDSERKVYGTGTQPFSGAVSAGP